MTGSQHGPERTELFLRLLAEHKDALHRLSRSLIWNKEGAEDALQDAVLAAFRGFDAFQEGTNFRAWIFQYLVNTIFNLNKKTRRSIEVQLTQADVLDLESPDSTALASEVLQEPAEILDLVSDPVKRAVLQLPQAQRTAFLLRSVNDFSYKEIARIMGAPMGTVMSLLSRARERLRTDLMDYEWDAGKSTR